MFAQSILAAVLVLLALERPAAAYLASDVPVIVNGYTNAFYYVSGTNGFIRDRQGTSSAVYFWQMANEIESVIDAYEWTTNTVYLGMITNLLNGFIKNCGSDWSYNGYNDDDLWAVMAFARGGMVTGKTNYCAIAKANFDMVYARGWDMNLGGGLYWLYPNNSSKNACVNGPGAIAAYLLYQAYGDTNYYTKAANIYAWERSVLYSASAGRVYDNININGTVDQSPTTYNQGTFIGAADYLGFTNDAALAANYTMNSLSGGGYLPRYGIAQNNSIFNSIFIRWMAHFMKNRSLEPQYQLWLQGQANAAWNGRRVSDNLSWCQWPQMTPDGTNFYSFDCISSFEAFVAVSPTQTTNATIVTLNATDSSGSSSFESGLNWSDHTAPSSAHDYVVSGFTLRTPADAVNHYFAGNTLTLTNGAVLACKNTSGGKGIVVGTELFLDNGEVADYAANSTEFSGKVTLRSGGGRLDPQGNIFTISALIGGAGMLRIKGAAGQTGGTLVFSGDNSYTGGTVIDAPQTLQLSGYGNLGDVAGSLMFSNTASLGYGTLNLNGVDLMAGNLSGTGGRIINNLTNAATLTIGNSNVTVGVFSGAISGNIELVKAGTGTLTLSRNTNSCFGGVNVTGGSLVVSNALLAVSNYLAVAFVGNVNSGTNIAALDASVATNFNVKVDTIQVGVTTNTAGGSPVIAAALKLGTNNYLNAASSIVIGDMGNTFNTNAQTAVTANNGTTTILAPSLTVGGSKASASFALGTGAKLNLGNLTNRTTLNLAVSPRGGSGSYLGTFDCSRGTFNGCLNGLTIGQLTGAGSGSETGLLTLSGGAANHLDITGAGTVVTIGKFVSGNAVGLAVGTLTVSNLDATSVIASTNNGTSVLLAASTNSVGTLNLNGGSLTLITTNSGIAGGAGLSTVNFGGVKLVAGANSASFITNITSAVLIPGGLILDTASFNVAVPQVFSDGGGGLTKMGDGIMTLSRAATFTGGTVIGGGTLALAGTGSIAGSSSVVVSNGCVLDVTGRPDQTFTLNSGVMLRGGGTIQGKLNALANSTVNPGDGIGILYVQGDVALSGSAVMELNRSGLPANDKLVSLSGTIAGGGTLTASNLGPVLQGGDYFQLFNQPVAGFTELNLPVLPVGYVWQDNLAVNGSIRVVSTNAVNLTIGLVANQLALFWPADHTGWRLQVQTNDLATGINTNWFNVSDTADTNQITLPVNPANASVFFRLIYP